MFFLTASVVDLVVVSKLILVILKKKYFEVLITLLKL